jgi:ribosomal protein L11 methyltransferase
MEQHAYPDYREYVFVLETDPSLEEETASMLIAELSVLGFESFTEEDGKVMAYIREEDMTQDTEISISEIPYASSYSYRTIKGQNWNAVWESNFEPIEIPGLCRIRADFHTSDPNFPLEIIVTPKMSFGTGHHATTRLMIEEMFTLDWKEKSVLDMGCGTGILAILAAKLGAKEVFAIDNDPQCIINTRENFDENAVAGDHIYLLESHPELPRFDRILANIQRNVLLDQMPFYRKHLAPGGVLLVSGIHEEDKEDLTSAAHVVQLKFDYFKALNGWIMMKFAD